MSNGRNWSLACNWYNSAESNLFSYLPHGKLCRVARAYVGPVCNINGYSGAVPGNLRRRHEPRLHRRRLASPEALAQRMLLLISRFSRATCAIISTG
jgi:hypothetical protein